MNFAELATAPRLLIQALLSPVQGRRFQPTGFADLGAAEYTLPDQQSHSLLVESAQSMANRLEAVCWDEANDVPVSALKGLPYVKAVLPDGSTTNSFLEAHRLNSPYIVNSPEFAEIQEAIGFEKDKPFERRRLAQALLRYDPNSLIHGIFLEKVGGVVRLPRALSAFIEADDVQVAPSGGVKIDRVQPGTSGDNTPYGKAAEGYGNVPFHRDEYTAASITAYFNLDLALIRGFGLGDAAERLLIALALFKVRAFLNSGLRLRTACDLEVTGDIETKPSAFALPTMQQLQEALAVLIAEASPHFSETRSMVVNYSKKGK